MPKFLVYKMLILHSPPVLPASLQCKLGNKSVGIAYFVRLCPAAKANAQGKSCDSCLTCAACSVRDWSGREARNSPTGEVVGESRSRAKPDQRKVHGLRWERPYVQEFIHC